MNYISDLNHSFLPSQEPINKKFLPAHGLELIRNKSLNTLPVVTIYKKITTPFYRSGYGIKIGQNFTNCPKFIKFVYYVPPK